MTDTELVQAYKSGDVNAFGKIYSNYIDRIYKFVYIKVPVKEIAEDLTSEVFFKCLKALEKFDPQFESALKSWIYTIAYNTVKDFYRTKKETVNIDEVFSLGIEENFGKKIDDKNKLEEVKQFLLGVKEEQREILIMRIWNDLSYKEIAEITGKSVDNCKKIVSRVLKSINANVAVWMILLAL